MNIFELMETMAKYSAMGFVFLGGVLSLTYTPVFATVAGYNLWVFGLSLWWIAMPIVEAVVLVTVLALAVKKVVELIKPGFFDFSCSIPSVNSEVEVAE